MPLSRGAKLAIAAVVVLAVVAAGIFALVRWLESERLTQAAEMQAMDQGSLDALKSQAARKVDRL